MHLRAAEPKESGFQSFAEFYPFYSLAGDFRMWWELNTGKLPFRE